jgi:hypothetical protein
VTFRMMLVFTVRHCQPHIVTMLFISGCLNDASTTEMYRTVDCFLVHLMALYQLYGIYTGNKKLDS